MTPLDIALQVLSLVATFVVGAWTGSSRCHLAIALDSNEELRDSWLDRACCLPRRSVSFKSARSGTSTESSK
jgi:hypothetical protein